MKAKKEATKGPAESRLVNLMATQNFLYLQRATGVDNEEVRCLATGRAVNSWGCVLNAAPDYSPPLGRKLPF